MADIKKALQEFVEQKKKEKEREKEERDLRNIEDRNAMIASIGTDLAEALKPVLAQLPESAKITAEQVKEALVSSIQVNIPEMKTEALESAIERAFANIQIPAPQVQVNVPEIKAPVIPPITIPEMKMPERMAVSMPDYSNEKPMPVMLMDLKGRPFQFPMGGGGGGGKTDFFTVKDIINTIGIVSINPDGTPAGAGSVASSVSVSDIFSTVGANVINPDGRIKVELPTGSSGLTDTELRAAHLDVDQVSGSSWSTHVATVSDIFSTTATSNVVNPDNRLKVELPAATLGVSQVSGVSWSISVVDIFGTAATSMVNADNRLKVELPAQTVTVSSITATTAVTGTVASDTADDGAPPVKNGGVARTANPTAVAAGDAVTYGADDLGRQLIRPVQVRDLIQTAYATLTNGTETTLRAAVAGASLDLIYVMGGNNSDAVAVVDIRAVTGGNIMMSLVIPPYGTAGVSLPVPIPQSEQGNNWTADMSDITGTTVYLSALFSQEV